MIALAGYTSTGSGWPLPYEQAKSEPLEALGTLIEYLGLDRPAYDQLAEQTHQLLADPGVQRFRDALARVLDRVPRVYEPEIRRIAEATGFSIPSQDEERELCLQSS